MFWTPRFYGRLVRRQLSVVGTWFPLWKSWQKRNHLCPSLAFYGHDWWGPRFDNGVICSTDPAFKFFLLFVVAAFPFFSLFFSWFSSTVYPSFLWHLRENKSYQQLMGNVIYKSKMLNLSIVFMKSSKPTFAIL